MSDYDVLALVEEYRKYGLRQTEEGPVMSIPPKELTDEMVVVLEAGHERAERMAEVVEAARKANAISRLVYIDEALARLDEGNGDA